MQENSSQLFSATIFGVALIIIGLGTYIGLSVLAFVGAFIGMFLASLVFGLAVKGRPIVEGATAAGVSKLALLLSGGVIGNSIGGAAVAISSVSPTTLLISVLLGVAVGAFGTHFGDDLREGLTTPVEEASAGTPVDRGPNTHPEVRSANQETTSAEPGSDKTPRSSEATNDNEQELSDDVELNTN